MGMITNFLVGVAQGAAANTAMAVTAQAAEAIDEKLKPALAKQRTKARKAHKSKVEKALSKNPENQKLVVRVHAPKLNDYKYSAANAASYTVVDGLGTLVCSARETRWLGNKHIDLVAPNGSQTGVIRAKTLASLSPFRNVYEVQLGNLPLFEIRSLAMWEKRNVSGSDEHGYRALYESDWKELQYGHYWSPMRSWREIRDSEGSTVAAVREISDLNSKTFVIDLANAEDGLVCAAFALVQCMEYMSARRTPPTRSGNGGGGGE